MSSLPNVPRVRPHGTQEAEEKPSAGFEGRDLTLVGDSRRGKTNFNGTYEPVPNQACMIPVPMHIDTNMVRIQTRCGVTWKGSMKHMTNAQGKNIPTNISA